MIVLVSFSEVYVLTFRSSRSEVFLVKGVLKICSKFKGECPCRCVILIKFHLGMGALLSSCCIFSERLLLRTPLDGCFWTFSVTYFECSSKFTYHIEIILYLLEIIFRSSHPEVFLRKGVLKVCSRFTGEYPCRSVISEKLQCNFV